MPTRTRLTSSLLRALMCAPRRLRLPPGRAGRRRRASSWTLEYGMRCSSDAPPDEEHPCGDHDQERREGEEPAALARSATAHRCGRRVRLGLARGFDDLGLRLAFLHLEDDDGDVVLAACPIGGVDELAGDRCGIAACAVGERED